MLKILKRPYMMNLNLFFLDPRYRKMDAFERARYRKEVKTRLIALSCVYLGFSAWWIIINQINA